MKPREQAAIDAACQSCTNDQLYGLIQTILQALRLDDGRITRLMRERAIGEVECYVRELKRRGSQLRMC